MQKLPHDDWWPPGSRMGSVSVYGPHDGLARPFLDAFWPAVERCLRR